jgi:hypothetical protein
MELTNEQIERIVHSVAVRFGVNGLVSAYRPPNRDTALVIQVRSSPSYEFEMESDAGEDAIRAKAEGIFAGAKKAS